MTVLERNQVTDSSDQTTVCVYHRIIHLKKIDLVAILSLDLFTNVNRLFVYICIYLKKNYENLYICEFIC